MALERLTRRKLVLNNEVGKWLNSRHGKLETGLCNKDGAQWSMTGRERVDSLEIGYF